VKAQCAERAHRAERPVAILAEEAVRRILDDVDAVARRKREDGRHLAADARVVHDDDRFRTRRDQALELRFVDVERVRPNVGEYRPRAAQHERVGDRHEGERWNDHLVAGLQVQQQRGHLQRMGAGRGDQRARDAERVSQQCLAALRERLIAGNLPDRHRLRDVLELAAGQRGAVEGNAQVRWRHHRHPICPRCGGP
jgi:hypothetical protein